MAWNEATGTIKKRFYAEFENILKSKDECISYMDNAQYDKFIEEVKIAKKTIKRTTLLYRRLKRFDVLNVDGVEMLIAAGSFSLEDIRYFAKNEQIFDILHEIHLNLGHRGRQRMIQEAQKKYKNITQEAVSLYLRLCESCREKYSKPSKKDLAIKPMTRQSSSRCRMTLIDKRTDPDGDFKFILVYQDYYTSFVQLRSLTNNTAEEVCKALLDIFCIFGAPSILQCDRGQEFIDHVAEYCMWPGLSVICGGHNDPQEVDNVQKLLTIWMQDKNCYKWADGLKYIQFEKNTIYRDDLKRSPFQAIFGINVCMDSKPEENGQGNKDEKIEMITKEEKLDKENIIKQEIDSEYAIEIIDDFKPLYCKTEFTK